MMQRVQARLRELRAVGRLGGVDGGTLHDAALLRLAEDPDRKVVVTAERSLTRAELFDAACRLGGAMLHRGIQPGAAIGFQLPNWWEACVISLTAALFGYRLVPLLTIYRSAELTEMSAASGLEAIFIPERFRNFDYPALISRIPNRPRHVFVVRGTGAQQDAFEPLLEHPPAPPEPPSPDDVKMILFTSGSTGRPKGVLHSHAALDALIRRTAEFWSIGRDDRLYIPSPIAHVGGSLYAFEFPWISGCTAVLAETWDAAQAVRSIEDLGCTFMAGATPFLSGLIDAASAAGTTLPGLRRFICGGASVPPDLVRRGLDQFASAVVSRAYGSTEIPLVCPGTRRRDDALRHPDTDGEIAVDIRILAEDGSDVTDGASGEIVARGPQMLMGYLYPADEEGCFTEDGYFRMGDLGRRVDGRFIEITGRKKDIIIRKGENISPLEIENALARHPAVRQSAVVGAPDPERGEMVVAFVLSAEGRSLTLPDLCAHLEQLGLARQKFPERLHLVTTLPMNAVGKVQKAELRAMAAAAAGQMA